MRYHISDDRVPRPCSAPPGQCPLGGEHYSTLEDAQQASEDYYSDELFPENTRLMVNTIDDVFEDNVDPNFLEDGLTQEEDLAIQDMVQVEANIDAHQKAVASGLDPVSIKNISEPSNIVKQYGDPASLRRAYSICDYESVREVEADAIARYHTNPNNDYRLDREELIHYGQEYFNPSDWS